MCRRHPDRRPPARRGPLWRSTRSRGPQCRIGHGGPCSRARSRPSRRCRAVCRRTSTSPNSARSIGSSPRSTRAGRGSRSSTCRPAMTRPTARCAAACSSSSPSIPTLRCSRSSSKLPSPAAIHSLPRAATSRCSSSLTPRRSTRFPASITGAAPLTDAAASSRAGRRPAYRHRPSRSCIATADRRINAYAATLPAKRLHIRSNSRAALHRVLDTVLGKSAPPLGATEEFQYIRTLFPLNANEEDGLVYLPHALLRRLVGPAVQITEARRLIGQTHLRMIAHAAALYRTQFGMAPATLDELTRTGCARRAPSTRSARLAVRRHL